jgi:hypothetical protein
MFVYTGFGWLTLFLFIAPFIVIGAFLNWVLGIDVLETKSSWPLHSIMVLGALLTFAFGAYFNRTKFEETIYEKSGPVKKLHTRHTLYWIPMQYWSVIFLLIYFAFFALRASKQR